MCERWFAADVGDGKVEREIMACEGGLGFSKVGKTFLLNDGLTYDVW